MDHHPHHQGGHAGPPSQPQHPPNIAAVHNHHAAKMMHPHEVENTCVYDVTLANVTLNRCNEMTSIDQSQTLFPS